MNCECITVRAADALKSVKREWHTRKEGCYILEDKHGTYLIVAQKLQAIASFLSTIAPDAASRISVTALYEILDNTDNRVGGWSKHRWRVRHAKLEDAGEAFEHARERFEHALVLGQADCYTFGSRQKARLTA